MDLKSNISSNWSLITLSEVTDKITKGSTPTSYGYEYQRQGINFVKTENIDNEGHIYGIKEYIDEDANEI